MLIILFLLALCSGSRLAEILYPDEKVDEKGGFRDNFRFLQSIEPIWRTFLVDTPSDVQAALSNINDDPDLVRAKVFLSVLKSDGQSADLIELYRQSFPQTTILAYLDQVWKALLAYDKKRVEAWKAKLAREHQELTTQDGIARINFLINYKPFEEDSFIQDPVNFGKSLCQLGYPYVAILEFQPSFVRRNPIITIEASPSVKLNYHLVCPYFTRRYPMGRLVIYRDLPVAAYIRSDFLNEFKTKHPASNFLSEVDFPSSLLSPAQNDAKIRKELLKQILSRLGQIRPIYEHPPGNAIPLIDSQRERIEAFYDGLQNHADLGEQTLNRLVSLIAADATPEKSFKDSWSIWGWLMIQLHLLAASNRNYPARLLSYYRQAFNPQFTIDIYRMSQNYRSGLTDNQIGLLQSHSYSTPLCLFVDGRPEDSKRRPLPSSFVVSRTQFVFDENADESKLNPRGILDIACKYIRLGQDSVDWWYEDGMKQKLYFYAWPRWWESNIPGSSAFIANYTEPSIAPIATAIADVTSSNEPIMVQPENIPDYKNLPAPIQSTSEAKESKAIETKENKDESKENKDETKENKKVPKEDKVLGTALNQALERSKTKDDPQAPTGNPLKSNVLQSTEDTPTSKTPSHLSTTLTEETLETKVQKGAGGRQKSGISGLFFVILGLLVVVAALILIFIMTRTKKKEQSGFDAE